MTELTQLKADVSTLKSGQQQIKGMVANVMQSLLKLAGVRLPTVDFCCDIFDRADSGVLNGYWQDTAVGNWTLRSNRAICQANPSSSSVITLSEALSLFQSIPITGTYASMLSPYISGTLFVAAMGNLSPVSSVAAPNLYAANISSADANIKIVFEVSGSPIVSVVNGYNPSYQVNTSITTNMVLPQSAGAIFGNAVGRSLGVVTAAALVPSGSSTGFVSPTSPTHPIPGVSVPAYTAFAGYFSDFASTTNTIPGTYASGSNLVTASYVAGSTTYGSPSASFLGAPAVNAGANVLLLQAIGSTYTVSLNGSVLYTVTTPIMLDRSQVGLTSMLMNNLATIINNGFPYTGITSFKAWINGQEEPPDQTGYGTYVNTQPQYADKYHTTDSQGQVVYNPLA